MTYTLTIPHAMGPKGYTSLRQQVKIDGEDQEAGLRMAKRLLLAWALNYERNDTIVAALYPRAEIIVLGMPDEDETRGPEQIQLADRTIEVRLKAYPEVSFYEGLMQFYGLTITSDE